jgi:hypothetical protein
MAKRKKYTVAWGIPADADIVSIRVRCSQIPFSTIPDDEANYAIVYDDVGKVSQCDLPLAHTPLIDGDLSIGVSAVDDVGNEGDIVSITIPFDLVVPSKVTNLRLL